MRTKTLPKLFWITLKQIGLKCKSAGVTKILISKTIVNNKVTSAYISSVHQRISNSQGSDVSNFIGSDQKIAPYHLVLF